MKIPSFPSSYQSGRGLLSKLSQSGLYLADDNDTKLAKERNNIDVIDLCVVEAILFDHMIMKSHMTEIGVKYLIKVEYCCCSHNFCQSRHTTPPGVVQGVS